VPELPEVEVTRRRIAPLLVGARVARLRTGPPSYFFVTPPRELQRRVTGRTLTALDRRGKYLLATLDDDSRLLLHLGMTGQLFGAGAASPRLLSSTSRSTLDPSEQPGFRVDQHTHLVFELEERSPVLFRDVRKFGKVAWIARGGSDARLDKLGVDALLATGDDLYAAARRRSAPIKSLLLDQSVIAGVGNIYADEALFRSRIRPTRRASAVSRADCKVLVTEAQAVMHRSIETGGSSISDYVQPDGSDGGYQDERLVYARAGEPCTSCGAPIARSVIGQRSTHWCRHCQR
jgi:formamidopyrimidine-DNA glycosylase